MSLIQTCLSDRFDNWIILHVMPQTIKECVEVVKSLTISHRINHTQVIFVQRLVEKCTDCFALMHRSDTICLNE